MNKYKILTLLFLLVSIGVESKANTRSDDPFFWLTDSIIDRELIQATNDKLIQAAKEGDINKITELLTRPSEEVYIDAKDNQGRTPLHWAAMNEHPEVVDVLLDSGATLGLIDNDGKSAFLLTKNSEIRKKISKAAEQDLLHAQLVEAIQEKDLKRVKKLVEEQGVSIFARSDRSNIRDRFGISIVQLNSKNIEIQKYLLSINRNEINEELMQAAKEGDIKKVTELLTRPINKANIDAKDNQGRTPLHWAAMNEHPEVVDVLLDSGATLGLIDNDGKSAFLLTKNSEIRKKISKATEQDLLHAQLVEAIQEEDLKRVKELVEKGASIYARGDSSDRLDIVLINLKNIEIREYLLIMQPKIIRRHELVYHVHHVHHALRQLSINSQEYFLERSLRCRGEFNK